MAILVLADWKPKNPFGLLGNFTPEKATTPVEQPTKPVVNDQPAANRAVETRDYLQSKGMSPQAAAAITGHTKAESEFNPDAVGDNGSAFGINQWRGDRKANLEKFAADAGKPANDYNTQLDFIIQELGGSEKRAGDKLAAATNVEEATKAYMHYLRPQGYQPDAPENGLHYDKRLANALALDGGVVSQVKNRQVATGIAADAIEAPKGAASIGVVLPEADDKRKGFAALVPAEPDPIDTQTTGDIGQLRFSNAGQDKLDGNFSSILKDTAASLGVNFTINSGYRSPSHPVEARKKTPGMHATGKASDISMRGMDDAQRQQLVLSLRQNGINRFGVYSNSPDMLHVDLKDQRGDGSPWFMMDRTAARLDRSPVWFQSAAEAAYKIKPSRAMPLKKGSIVVDDGFEIKDTMGLGLEKDPAFMAARANLPTNGPIPEPRPEQQQQDNTGFVNAQPDPVLDAAQGAIDETRIAALDQPEPDRQSDLQAQNVEPSLSRDTAIVFVDSFVNTGLALREAVSKIPVVGGPVVKAMEAVDEWVLGSDSAEKLQQAQQRNLSGMSDASKLSDVKKWTREYTTASGTTAYGLGPAWSDPRSYLFGAARSAPAMAATMGPTGLLARATYATAIAKGATPLIASAASAKTALIAGGITEGIMAGGQTSLAIKEQIAALPRETLEQSEAIKTLVKGGMSFDEAVTAISEDASTQGFLISGVATGLVGGLADKALVKIIADGVGGNVVKRIAYGAGRGAVAEGLLEEGSQGAADSLAINIGVRNVDPSRPLTQGMGEAIAGGIAVGGVMGGGMGAVAGAASPSADADTPALAEPSVAPQADTPANNALAAPDAAPNASPTQTQPRGSLTAAIQHAQQQASGRAQAAPVTADAGPEAAAITPDTTAVPTNAVNVAYGQTPPTPQMTPPTFAPGAKVRVEAEGLDAFDGVFDTLVDDGEAIIVDTNTGEFLQVPVSALANVEPTQPDAQQTEPDAQIASSAPEPATIAGQVADAVERSRQPAPATQSVDERVTDTAAPVAAPVAAAPVAATRRVNQRETTFPDAAHGAVYDLGEKLRIAREDGAMPGDRMNKILMPQRQAAADALGVPVAKINSIANEYRSRVAKNALGSTEAYSAPALDQNTIARAKALGEAPTVVQSAQVTSGNVETSKVSLQDAKSKEATSAALPQASEVASVISTPKASAAPVEAAAIEDATSPANDLPEPTQAQKEAGNYKLGHAKMGGLDLSIENPAGSQRKGVDKSGKAWSVTMKDHYGYIKGTVGRDKDHIDVFVKPNTSEIDDNAPVFVVDQNVDGKFDEHKVMIGYADQAEAQSAYMANYDKNWKGLGAITPTTLGEFKEWTKGNTTKPFAKQSLAQNAYTNTVKIGNMITPERARDYVLARGRVSNTEHLVITNQDNRVVDVQVGSRAFVAPSAQVFAMFSDPSQQMTIHHNHPSGSPLSQSDLALTFAPGITSVSAYGHHGENYTAKATPFGKRVIAKLIETDPVLALKAPEFRSMTTDGKWVIRALFERAQPNKYEEELFYLLQELVFSGKISTKQAKNAEAHTKALILQDVGLIEYTSELMDDMDFLDYPEIKAATALLQANIEKEVNDVGGANTDRRTQPAGVPERVEAAPEIPVSIPAKPRASGNDQGSKSKNREENQPNLTPPATSAATQSPKTDAKQFENNKLFTADRVAAARARLKSKLGNINSGIDPELIMDGLTIAGAYIESGVRNFSDYAAQMSSDFGDGIKPYLLSFWEASRNYPGLDTAGMTPVDESAQLHAALNTTLPQSEAAALGAEIAAPTGRAARKGTPQDRVMVQDYGVDHIDAYSDAGEIAKKAFLKDAEAYLKAVSITLMADGYTVPVDRKGRTRKPVNKIEGAIGVSGDVYLQMAHQSNGNIIFVTIGASGLRGVAPTSPSGISMMMRTGKKEFGIDGINQWVPTTVTARELAFILQAETNGSLQSYRREARNEPAKLGQTSQGTLAGAPAQTLQSAEPSGQTGRSPTGSSQPDLRRSVGSGGSGVQRAGGLGTSPREIPVPAAGSTPEKRVLKDKPADSIPNLFSAAVNRVDTNVEGSIAVTGTNRPDEFTITDDDAIGQGGAKTKYRQNIVAIKLIKDLELNSRQPTRAEQALIAKWVGWGGLSQAFYRSDGSVSDGWKSEAAELKALLTDDEYRAAENSTRNAHYTAPEIVKAIWSAVDRLGFKGGKVLEPSVGSGNFLGLMPTERRAGSHITGVELDAITGGVAKALYPGQRIVAPMGFQKIALPNDYFDLAIGNPPFGSEKLYDAERREISKFSIHNFFFAKSVDALRPGGVLAMVVTNSFLDAQTSDARNYIAARADLIGAIRLPNTAFLANAGTAVTTDIIFLRKRMAGERPTNANWTTVSSMRDKEGRDVAVNAYFKANPDNMLGEFGLYGTMYRAESAALIARAGDNLAELLAAAIERLPVDIMPSPGTIIEETVLVPDNVTTAPVGGAFIDKDGNIWTRLPDMLGAPQAERVVDASQTAGSRTTGIKAAERMVGLIGLRDAFARIRKAQIDASATDDAIKTLRADLNNTYDGFVKANGPINGSANKQVFRDDPTWPQVAALEKSYDKGISAAIAKTTGESARAPSAEKADIFFQRTQQPYKRQTSASNAKDAMLTVMSEYGRVDMSEMVSLYGKPEEDIVAELGPLLYKLPEGGYDTADGYLSGNVKAKLKQATEAATKDAAFEGNVDALKLVIPADIEALDINIKAGSPWIPKQHIEAFINHLAEMPGSKAVYARALARWDIRLGDSSRSAEVQWSTSEASISKVIEAALNDRPITIYDKIDDKLVVNAANTAAANEKVQRVKEEWQRWIWQDDARREELAGLYNDIFNTSVIRKFDGAHMQLPGFTAAINLRPHQKSFVWRGLQSSTVLADHTVGAGKTYAAIALVIEMKRTGMARKPLVTVPNHLVSQWASDFLIAYPNANILAATKKDFEAGNRKKLFARMATGDYDAIIVAHSSFGRVGVDVEFEAKFIRNQIENIAQSENELLAEGGKSSRSVKSMAKKRADLESKLERLFDAGRKDNGLTFNEIGIDALVVDEAHEFKNLAFATSMTRVAGLGNPAGSQKAADLYMKIDAVKERTGGRNIVFLSGTPISNTMAELYTVQRYLDAENLTAMGLDHFDAWARVFGEVVNDWELSPSGKYKMNSRFAKFVNMPELTQIYRSFADVVSNDDIKAMLAGFGQTLPIPRVKGGKPQIVIVERSADQADYIGVPVASKTGGDDEYPAGTLVYRAEHLPKKAEKGADNMLKVMSDARKAALDMRLINLEYPDNPGSKIHVAADKMVALYKKWDAQKGAQLVFIDLSTPKAARSKEADRIKQLQARADDGDEDASEALDKISPDELLALESDFSVYDDLRQKLINRGISPEEIAFVHSANSDLQKDEMFGKVRSGRIRFLFGSTAKMGAGTNVQTRLVALHHMDAPWRPSDLEQREGRIIRQKNALYDADPDGFEVEILRYATKNTLDARMWQTIEQKARFIQQVRAGLDGSREIEDIGGEASNSAEMKAAASGNPLILEEMDLRQKVKKLERQSLEHEKEQHRVKAAMALSKRQMNFDDAALSKQQADAAEVAATKALPVVINGVPYDKTSEYGAAIIKAAENIIENGDAGRAVGSWGGFTISVEPIGKASTPTAFAVVLEGQTRVAATIESIASVVGVGIGSRLNNMLAAMVNTLKMTQSRLDEAKIQLPKLEAQLAPFANENELIDAKVRHNALIDKLKPKSTPVAAAPTAPVDPLPDGADASIAADGAIELRLSPEQQTRLAGIVQRVSGLKKTAFTDRITVAARSPDWGNDTPTTASGYYDPATDSVVLALDSATDRTAYHEAFHRLQSVFMSDKDKLVLASDTSRLKALIRSDAGRRGQVDGMSQKELEAEAFAIWSALPENLQNGAVRVAIRSTWMKLTDTIRRTRNAIKGMGFRSVEDVFKSAASGQIAQGQARKADGDRSYRINEAPTMVRGRPLTNLIAEIQGSATDLQPALLKTVPLNYFQELARPNMTAVKDYLLVKRSLDAYRGDRHAKSDEIAQRWLKVTAQGFLGRDMALAQDLADLMHESTLTGVDPSLTDKDTRLMTGYGDMRKRFSAMPADAQAVYVEVRDAYKEQTSELDSILLDNVKKVFRYAQKRAEEKYDIEKARIFAAKLDPAAQAQALKDAGTMYTAALQRGQYALKARLTKLRIALESSRMKGPYFPLMRHGSYFVSAKDQNGDTISFSRAEGSAEQKRIAVLLRREYPKAEISMGRVEEKASARESMDPRIVAEIEEILGNLPGVPNAEMAEVMDQIWQRYLETMPDLSMRKRFIHRKGTEGFDKDALRSFSSHMFHAGHQMGRLKYGIDLQETLADIVQQGRMADDPVRGMTLANEMKYRHEWVMNPTGSSTAQSLTTAAFVWYLAATPAAAIINTTQTAMLGIPNLGAKFGVAKAAKAIAMASKDSVAGYGLPSRANLTADEKHAIAAFYKSGLIDRTQSHDLAGVGDVGVNYSPMKSRIMGTISKLFHVTEVWNREVTALAAYRLARDAGQDARTAIDTAHGLTWDTHFDYSNSSRPRIMQNDFMKVLLVFRSHNINMLYRLFRSAHQSLKGDTAQARREARVQFTGIFAMQALVGGVTAMAGFNLAMSIMGLFFGDEDDPYDFETRVRADVIEVFGPDLGGIVLNGAPGHFTGIALSNRIGMPDLWFRSPNKDLEGKALVQEYAFNSLGAVVSLAGSIYQGLEYAMDGNMVKGIEVAAPKPIKDVLKSYRYATEGVVDNGGNSILPVGEISSWDIAMQLNGFTPAKIAETYERNSALKNAEGRIQRKRTKLLNRFAMANQMKDKEERAVVIQDIKQFNAVELHRSVVITPKSLLQSAKTRARNDAKRIDGALIQNPGLGMALRDQLPGIIYREPALP